MSREEAAAKAMVDRIVEAGRNEANAIWVSDMSAALAAADAHDAAHGIHRVSLDDATVERAARVLCESIWKLPNAWELSEDLSKDSYRAHARIMLAAAVEEDGE